IHALNEHLLKVEKDDLYERVPALKALKAMNKTNISFINRNNRIVLFNRKMGEIKSRYKKLLDDAKKEDEYDSKHAMYLDELDIESKSFSNHFDVLNADF